MGLDKQTTAPTTAPQGEWRFAEPYLHLGPDRVYNPLTDRTLRENEALYAPLRTLLADRRAAAELPAEILDALDAEGWIVSADAPDLDRRYRLMYVSLETHSVCNQSCYFCPVAYDPRKPHFMPTELFEDIVAQLAAYRDTLEGICLINYNEPTLDKRFVDQVRCIMEHGLPPAVLTNATGLTPDRIDAIVEMGGLRYLSINLSTLDREQYREERGGDHLPQVLANLEYARHRPVADEMVITVLGKDDEVHRRDAEAIRERFAEGRFVVRSHEVMNRAGYLDVGRKPARPHTRLRGCEVIGSRPIQHLHIAAEGKCLLCSEDYGHRYVVGDIRVNAVDEVMAGPELSALRRWVYGLEEAPDDFICRGCVFALTD